MKAFRYVAEGAAAAPVSSAAFAQGPNASTLGGNTAPGLYATAMELPGARPCILQSSSMLLVILPCLPEANACPSFTM